MFLAYIPSYFGPYFVYHVVVKMPTQREFVIFGKSLYFKDGHPVRIFSMDGNFEMRISLLIFEFGCYAGFTGTLVLSKIGLCVPLGTPNYSFFYLLALLVPYSPTLTAFGSQIYNIRCSTKRGDGTPKRFFFSILAF